MKTLFMVFLFTNLFNLFSENEDTPQYSNLIGNWSGKEIVTVRTKINGKYNFIKSPDSILFYLNISENGMVSGSIGNATLEDCYLKKNRNWLEEKLNFATDYVVRGKLMGKIFENDPIESKDISIPFNIINFKTEGTLFQLEGFLNFNLYPMSNFRISKTNN